MYLQDIRKVFGAKIKNIFKIAGPMAEQSKSSDLDCGWETWVQVC